MARRRGRLGEYLMTDDDTGFTQYASKMRRDFWGNYTNGPLKRNLQEIAKPLNDPRPVPVCRGPNYEAMPDYCLDKRYPIYVGLTSVKTKIDNAYIQALHGRGGVGSMELECDFYVS